MSDGTRASLVLLAFLSALGIVPQLLRGWKPTTLLALHAVGVFVALKMVIVDAATPVLSTGLALPYLAMLALIVVDQRGQRSSRLLRMLASATVAIGLLSSVSVHVWPRSSSVLFAVCAIAALALVTMTVAEMRQVRAAHVADAPPVRRLVVVALLFAAVTIALPVVSLIVPFPSAHVVWPLALGTAGAIVTSVRMAPHVAPTPRELVVAGFLGVAAFFVTATFAGVAAGALAALFLTLFDIGIVAASRPLLESSRGSRRREATLETAHTPLVVDRLSRDAIGALTPLLDHPAVLRASGGALAVRVTAQHLLDAAIRNTRLVDDSRSKSRSRITQVVENADADIECDPSELSSLLSDLLLAAHTDGSADEGALSTRVHVRAGPRHVTYEITGERDASDSGETVLPLDLDRPFSVVDGATPSLALARARVVIERHGGNLIYRQIERGHFVQVTIPRRLQRQRSARA
jgi:hypothetical protein